MPPPKPPSRIEPLAFPVFAISWFVDPSTDGRKSIVAYCGGGGSAKTGVNNSIVVHYHSEDFQPPEQLRTHEQVGVALQIYTNPVTRMIFLLVGLGKQVWRYKLPANDGEPAKQDIDEAVNAIAINALANLFAVGCENGLIKVYETTDEEFSPKGAPKYLLEGHKGTICALAFSLRGQRLVSSAKDGMAALWSKDRLLGILKCSVTDNNSKAAPPPKRPPQVLVRGCAFGDLEGKVVFTVASARRGKAFLARWEETPEKKFACTEKSECSKCPVSAMSMSQDGSLIALGNVEGSIILWDVEKWKPLKIFQEIHHLPVTCIAARPFPFPLPGEEEDRIPIHARSASADSQLACLTLLRRAPRKPGAASSSGGSSFGILSVMKWIQRAILVYVWSLVLSPVWDEARAKCGQAWEQQGFQHAKDCFMEEVLIAPDWRPGVLTPPY